MSIMDNVSAAHASVAEVKERSRVADKIRLVCVAAALVLLTALAAACTSSNGSSRPSGSAAASVTTSAGSNGKTIAETGSTLLFPLFRRWQVAYSSVDPSVTITSGATGSGAGVAAAAAGRVNIGASDAFLSNSDLIKYPGLLNIPITVAALDVNYNVTGITKPLNLNGTVLGQIYAGKIRTWNDPAIAKLNPGVRLPSEKIVTLHRADSSGSTLLFTSYLNAQDPTGWPASDVGMVITWPLVPGSLARTGNGGMLSGCKIKGCIAYIGISYLTRATAAGLGTASLADSSGTFEAPTNLSIDSAVASFPALTASGAESLINSSSGYPIVNYEYAIVKRTQPSAAEASAIKAFLDWIETTGDTPAFVSAFGFRPMPTAAKKVAETLVDTIDG
jgi:phosphate transport system substrate-binding protein